MQEEKQAKLIEPLSEETLSKQDTKLKTIKEDWLLHFTTQHLKLLHHRNT